MLPGFTWLTTGLAVLLLSPDIFLPCKSDDDTYISTSNSLFHKILNTDTYDKRTIPRESSSPVSVFTRFYVIAVGIDDVTHTASLNTVVNFGWSDSRLAWRPRDHGDIDTVYTSSSHVWLPNVLLINTMGRRNVFKTEESEVMIKSDGGVTWVPGNVMTFSCNLDMTKYPFDLQICSLNMTLNQEMSDVVFSGDDDWLDKVIDLDFYVKNEEWDLEDIVIKHGQIKNWLTSSLELEIHLRRIPTFVILNIILPVVCLAFLNILTFLIPASSGQRISYAVTMLLALTVFLSIVSDRIPHSAKNIPRITVYICVTMTLSAITLIECIATELLHGLKRRSSSPEDDVHDVDEHNLGTVLSDSVVNLVHMAPVAAPVPEPIIELDLATAGSSSIHSSLESIGRGRLPVNMGDYDGGLETTGHRVHSGVEVTDGEVTSNRYTVVCKYIDLASLVLYFCVWIAMTVFIFIEGFY